MPIFFSICSGVTRFCPAGKVIINFSSSPVSRLKSEQGIATMLGLRTPWQAKDYMAAMRKYSGVKTMQIVGEIRYADAKSKGVKNSSMSDGDILRELVFKILH